jgi:hypothetical protein
VGTAPVLAAPLPAVLTHGRGVDVESLDAVELGAALEPILAAAEAHFLEEYEASRAAEDLGVASETPGVLRRDPVVDDVLTLRGAAFTRHGVREGYERGPRRRRERTRFNIVRLRSAGVDVHFGARPDFPGPQGFPPPSLAAAAIYQGRYAISYEGIQRIWGRGRAPSIERLAPTHRGLAVLERARARGMLPTMDLAEALARSGHATTEAVTFGDLAPMAPGGATKAAAEDWDPNQPQPYRDPAERAEIESARRTRRERIRNIFVRLRQVVRQGRGNILGLPGGRAEGLVQAFQNWANAHFSPAAARDQAAVDRAALTLAQELVMFLRAYRG